METKKRPYGWLCLLLVSVLSATLGACSSGGDDLSSPEPSVDGKVPNPVRVVSYEQTSEFKSDLDLMVTYMLNQRALRWSYLMMASNGNSEEAPFSATLEDIDGPVGALTSQYMYNILDEMSENAEQYEAAFERLSESGVFDMENSKTRGYKSDVAEFAMGLKKAEKMGRQSVMAILRKGGWATDTQKLKELYNTLPSNLTRGYSDYYTFWQDFSAGRIDSRSNQVFVNLYTYDPMDFGSQADDLGLTPARNMSVAGADLISKGLNVVLDASPLATQLSYGKDLYGAVDATQNLVKEGDVKGFLQNVAGNIINYGRNVDKIYDKLKNNDVIYWEAADDFWDNYGQDIATLLCNDVIFSDQAKEEMGKGQGEHLIPNLIKTRDVNGNEITIMIIQDQRTGQLTAGYVLDKDGNIIADPKLPGIKKITVVDRQGRRKTKTVTVDPDEPTEVIFDLEKDEQLLEEDPANGDITLKPGSIHEKFGLSGTEDIRVYTNYLYYNCYAETGANWLSAKPHSETSMISVTYAANDTGEPREAKVFVVGTNKEGKVLKEVVLKVRQEPKEAEGDLIWTTPGSVSFDAEGGKQNIVVNHAVGYSFIGLVEGSDLAGWCTLEYDEGSDAGSPTYVIDCKPNTTGEERSGTAIFLTANSRSALENVLYNGAQPDGTTVAATTVLIKQSAGQETPTDIVIDEIKVYPHLAYSENDGIVYEDVFDVWQHTLTVNNISVSKVGDDKIYVVGTYSGLCRYSANNSQQETTVTFYIENISQDYNKWKIVSLNVDDHNYLTADFWFDNQTSYTATNIPFEGGDNFGSIQFDGKASDGVSGISGISNFKGYNGYDNYTGTIKSAEWEGNHIEVWIEFAK